MSGSKDLLFWIEIAKAFAICAAIGIVGAVVAMGGIMLFRLVS